MNEQTITKRSTIDLISNINVIYLILIGITELNCENIRIKDENEKYYY